MILTDDLGFNDLGINNNNTEVHTPNLDRVAQQGIRFTRHYTGSTCSPSRGALLSGQYPARNGYRPNSRGLSPDVTTLADSLKSHGYLTHHIGKWHMGDTVELAQPHHQGFDSWFGFLNQWRLQVQRKDGELVLGRPTYRNPWIESSSGSGEQFEGHLTDILTNHASQKIRELGNKKQPWFINLWYYAPHGPIQPAKRYKRRYPNTPKGKYHALLHQLDDGIGKILKTLEKSGQTDNTIVLIASDNGGTNMCADNNLPFYGKKTFYHEGGVRTPLLIRWPHHINPGQISDETVAIFDILPTVASLVGAPIPDNIDGIDISPAFQGKKLPARTLFWEFYYKGNFGYSVLSEDGRWRLYKVWPWSPWDKPPELYDLATDPTGHKEVFQYKIPVAQALQQKYSSWHHDVHRTRSTFTANGENGHGLLIGDDFQRSPGFGGFTFAIGITPIQGRTVISGTIAQQPGLWSLKLKDKVVQLVMGIWEVEKPVTLVNGCNLFIVTGDFYRRTSSRKNDNDSANFKLFVNGQELLSVNESGKLKDEEFLKNPTYLGQDADGKERLNAQLSRAVLLNKQVSTEPPLTILDVEGEIGCQPASR